MTGSALALLHDVPDSPVGRQLAWDLRMLLSKGEDVVPADVDRYAPALGERIGVELTFDGMRADFRNGATRMGEILDIAIDPESDFRIHARLLCAKDRKFRMTLEVEPEAPNRITVINWERLYDFKLDVREATEADAAILADIERRCPIVLRDTQIHFDRGEDYFAFVRLMEDCTIGIASVDGAPAAVSCGARHTVRIGGALKRIITVSHLRVLPEHQRKGLWGAANRALDKYWPTVDGSNAYISVDNAGMQHGFRTTPSKYPLPLLRLQLDCASLAGRPAGRAATPADIPELIALLNTFHDREEMFVPYTEERFLARLSRAPAQYSFDKLLVADGAAVGVWPAGGSLRVVSETNGKRSESVRGVVLDYAFAPGAEAAFESLLRAWCARLRADGMDSLSIFSSPSSPGVSLLRALARECEAFNMWTPGISVPPDAEANGLYVDPIYF